VPQHHSPGLGDLKKQRKLLIEAPNTEPLQTAWGVSWLAVGWQLFSVSAERSSEHLLSRKAALGISSAQFPTRSLLKSPLHGAKLTQSALCPRRQHPVPLGKAPCLAPTALGACALVPTVLPARSHGHAELTQARWWPQPCHHRAWPMFPSITPKGRPSSIHPRHTRRHKAPRHRTLQPPPRASSRSCTR